MPDPSSDDVTAARADLDKLVRRLRGFSRRAWSTDGREAHIRALAEALVVIGGDGHPLPELPTHALADVIAVVGHDALDMQGAVPGVRALLLDALDATR